SLVAQPSFENDYPFAGFAQAVPLTESAPHRHIRRRLRSNQVLLDAFPCILSDISGTRLEAAQQQKWAGFLTCFMRASRAKRGVSMHKLTCRFAVGLLCLMGYSAYAQEVSAGITGRVTDPSGGAIVGAAVTAKDQDRGTEWP